MQYAKSKNYQQKVEFSPYWPFFQMKKSKLEVNFTGFEDSSKLEFQIYMFHKNTESPIFKNYLTFYFISDLLFWVFRNK